MSSEYNPIYDLRFRVKLSKPVYEVYVGGLRYSASEDEVRHLFSKYGRVVSVIIPITRNGQTKGCAFVSFSAEAEAKAAMAALDHTEFLGRTIFVEEKRPFDPNAPRVDRSRPDQPEIFPRHQDKSFEDNF